MYDLKPDAPAEIRGEFQPIRTTVPGMDLCELMPLQAKIADRIAIVRNLKMSTSGHTGLEVITGFLRREGSRGDAEPALGSVVSRVRGAGGEIPPYVSLVSPRRAEAIPGYTELPGYLGTAHRPFVPSGPAYENLALSKGLTLDRLQDRKELLRSFDTLRQDLDGRSEMAGVDAFTARALEMITSTKARDAFDLEGEPDRVREKYGTGEGRDFLLARRLVEAGVGIVTLAPACHDWDTHGDNFNFLRRHVPRLDRGLHALVSDLHDRGLGKDVTVVMWGEFGRSPKINSKAGREHWGEANFAFFAGGGLKMGQVVGATDAHGARPKGRPATAQNVLATVYRALGIDLSQTVAHPSGRPMYILDDREPIAELL